MSTSNTTIHSIKHTSEYEGSPCINCLVKVTCTKSMLHSLGACQAYKDFLMKMIQSIRENQ